MEETTSRIVYSILTFSLFVLLLTIALILLFMNYVKNKKHLLRENEIIREQFAQTLMESQLEIQEQVFTQVSQEIHDNIGQVLSLVRLNINTLGEAGNEEKIRATDQLLGKAIQDLRSLSHTLNTNYIKEVGLVEACRQLIMSLQRTGQFKTTFESTANHFHLGDDKAIILFRIVQEAINNIIRHAHATEIHFSIEGDSAFDRIRIQDNGKGFDSGEVMRHGNGMGLKNMMLRAQMVQTRLEVESTRLQGTLITITNEAKQ